MTDFVIITLREQPDQPDDFRPQKQRIWAPFKFHDVYTGLLPALRGRTSSRT